MIRITIGVSLLLFVIQYTSAQKKSNRDSLLHIVKQNGLTDTIKVRTLNELSKTYRLSLPDSSIYFAEQAYSLASRIGDVSGIATALNFIGVGFFYMGDYPEAQKYQHQALDFAELHHLGQQKSNALNSLALAFQYQGNYITALENYLRALKIVEEAKNYPDIIKVLANAAILFKKQGDIDNAIAYSNRAMELTKHLKDPRISRANISNNLGSAYIEKKDFVKALDYFQISLRLHEELHNTIFISSCLMNIGYCYFGLDEMKKAEEFLYEGLAMARETGASDNMILSLINLTAVKIKQGKLDEALAMTQESLNLARPLNNKDLIYQNYRNLATIYQKKGDFKRGYDFLEKAMLLNDTLRNNHINKKINDLQNSYALNKKQGEVMLLEKDAKIKQAELKEEQRLRDRLLIIVLALVIMASLVYQGFRVKSTLSKKLQKQNEMIELINKDLQARALRAQMNPHFIFNALNSIQFLIMEKQSERAFDYLAKFAMLLRQVMENSEKDWISLSEEMEVLKLYLDLEALRFNGAFTYSITANRTDGLKIPPLIVQPYVENAIRHGLLPKRGDKELKISFSGTEHQLVCEVKDNGIGRSAATVLQSKNNKLFSSKGMNYTSERIQILNTQGGHSKVLVNDLIEQDQPAGTSVKITIDYV